jgi:methyl-accepting chemotaxis protein
MSTSLNSSLAVSNESLDLSFNLGALHVSGLWKSISHPHLVVRLQFIVATSLLCLALLGGLAVYERYHQMLDARVDKLRAITEQAVSIAADLERAVQAGALTRDQAIQRYRDIIRPIRYDGGAGYYFVYDMDANTLVLGPTPKVEGTNRIDIRDADGKFFLKELIAAVRQGGGTTIYRYPKPGSENAQPKLAYVLPVPGWNIFVGTGLYIDDVRTATMASIVRFSALVGALLVICIGVAWIVSRGITRPLSRLQHSMMLLANGELGASIAGIGRQDEIGDMAGAVAVFKEHMVKERDLAAAEAQERIHAEQVKHAALVEMADTIERDTTAALYAVGERTAAMTATAQEMSASAVRTGQSAQSAASASAHALANAQTVASAADQLSASIREISSQAGESSAVVSRAVAAGVETRATILDLNEQVMRIGAVADIIGAIAAKTNLLALNATIEAARAGDAGKGFAVVASEVKALATQTAHSTSEIAQHIDKIRGATDASVAAVDRIEQTIGEINTIAGSIAAAVEEQGAATAEISRNVTETASAAKEMAGRTAEVSSEAEQTGRHAAEVRENAAGLNSAMGELRHSVIRAVRTSTTQVDRREADRHKVELGCRISVPGQEARIGQVIDISEGGASVKADRSLAQGARGTLHLDNVDIALPFTVVAAGDDDLHLKFHLDDTETSKLKSVIERFIRRRAA